MPDVPPLDKYVKLWDGKYYVAEEVERSAPGLVAYVRENPEYVVDFLAERSWYSRQLWRKLRRGTIGLAAILLTLYVFYAIGLMNEDDTVTVAVVVTVLGLVGIGGWLLQKKSSSIRRIGVYGGEVHISRMASRRVEHIRRCVWENAPDKIDEFAAHGMVYRFLPEEGTAFLVVDNTGGRFEQFLHVAGIRQWVRPSALGTACVALAAAGAAFLVWYGVYIILHLCNLQSLSVSLAVIINGAIAIVLCAQFAGSLYYQSNRFIERESLKSQIRASMKEAGVKAPFLILLLVIKRFPVIDALLLTTTTVGNVALHSYFYRKFSRYIAYRAHRRHRAERMNSLT